MRLSPKEYERVKKEECFPESLSSIGRKRPRKAEPKQYATFWKLYSSKSYSNQVTTISIVIMSMFGFGRPQPSSAEKIAAAEQEMDLVTDMFNK
jgi:hypothetical protein